MARYIFCSYDDGAVEVSVDYHDNTLNVQRAYVVNNGTAPLWAEVVRTDIVQRIERIFEVGTSEDTRVRNAGYKMRVDNGEAGPANFQFNSRYPA